jgi:DNA-binding CsgD family transcriptional regulator
MIVGRDGHLAVLRRFVSAADWGACLVLWGQAGVGKTTLWEAGVAEAQAGGQQVLAARASPAEAGLAFAGLIDLFDNVPPAVFDRLSVRQRHALEVALRREEPSGNASEPLAISVAVLTVLRELAESVPVLVALDDGQWLDVSSAEVLRFAARRLVEPGKSRVRFLLTRRSDQRSSLETVWASTSVELVELSGISVGALSHMVRDRLGLALPRRVLRELHQSTAGNPLFALEMARLFKEKGVPAAGSELPVPDVVDDLFADRVRGLSPPVRRVVLAVSLSADVGWSELATMVDAEALDEALESGLVVLHRLRLRVWHPLLGVAAVRYCSRREWREMHRALASVASDEVLRAGHLALASPGTDVRLAATVAAGAGTASARGAVYKAQQLAAQALRLTPPEAIEYPEHLLLLAQCHLAAGDAAAIRELLVSRVHELPPGRARSMGYLLLGEASEDEERCLELALQEGGEEADLRARALARRATILVVSYVERVAEAEESARQALAAARGGEPDVEALALSALAWCLILRGRPLDELSSTGPSGEAALRYDLIVERPLGVRFAFRGEVESARVVFARLLDLAEERGDLRLAVVIRVQLCELALRCGDVRSAKAFCDELDEWLGPEESHEESTVFRTRLRAVLGAVSGAAAPLEGLEDLAASLPKWGAWDRLELHRALGVTAMFDQDYSRAVEHLGAVWDHTSREQIDDPGAFPVVAELVEALSLCGDRRSAAEVTARLGQVAVAQDHPWGLVTTRRCRAVITMADGYDEGAARELEQVADEYGRMGLLFDQARTLLFVGAGQRRHKKRTSARGTLERSRDVFERQGCSGWAGQARLELSRLSGRRPSNDELTPSERRVVELAASGLSNKEIAQRLVVGVYTVEAHLRHAYAKMGIRSRSQLARWLTEHH